MAMRDERARPDTPRMRRRGGGVGVTSPTEEEAGAGREDSLR